MPLLPHKSSQRLEPEPTPPARLKPPTRRPTARLFLGLLLAGAAWGALLLPGAWRETQRREASLLQLEAMARQDPYDGRLLALLGGRQMEAGEFAAAADTLSHAIAAGEKTEPVWLTLACAKAAVGDPQARGYLGMGAHTLDTPGLAAAQTRCAALGPTASAFALAAAICPQGPKPLVDAYSQGSFLNRPVEWWGRRHPNSSGFATRQDWVRQQPNDAQAQRLWGQALLENRRWADAADALQRAVALAPTSPDAHLALAGLLERQATPAQAALEYVACLKLRPDWRPALLGLGRATLAVPMPITAADVYLRATQIGPQSAEAWVGLGQADVMAHQNFGVALHAFQTAAQLAPVRTDFFAAYSEALRENGRWDEAEGVLRRLLTADPADAAGHLLLGGALLDHDPTAARVTEAEAETRVALRLVPKWEPALQQMADLRLHQGQPLEAARWLRQEIAEDPVNVKARLSLARADQQAGLTAQAAQVSQQATELSSATQQIDALKSDSAAAPSNVAIHQRLAALYARIGQADKARQEQEAIALIRAQPGTQAPVAQSLQSIIAAVLTHH